LPGSARTILTDLAAVLVVPRRTAHPLIGISSLLSDETDTSASARASSGPLSVSRLWLPGPATWRSATPYGGC
jgi:hypothetical protein